MNKLIRMTIVASCILLTMTLQSIATTPTLLNYQGRMTDLGGTPLTGNYDLTFTIYDSPSGGVNLWTETQSSVSVADGLFEVLLGSVNPLHDSVFSGSDRYVGLAIGIEPELSPRTQLTTNAYSFRTATLDGAESGHISGDTYFDGNIGVGISSPQSALDVNGIIYGRSLVHNGVAITARNTNNNSVVDLGCWDSDNGMVRVFRDDGSLGVYLTAGPLDISLFNGDVTVNGVLIGDTVVVEGLISGKSLTHNGIAITALNTNGNNVVDLGCWDSNNGMLRLFQDDGTEGVHLSAGPNGESIFRGNLTVTGLTTTDSIEITGGLDIAESFEIAGGSKLPEGSVMVIDEANPGKLRASSIPYDKRVAGIASGANGIRPGLTLSHGKSSGSSQKIALTGRVYALASAENGPIVPGDRLTTSSTPGHCMRASDPIISDGAVIGKAMSRLDTGIGQVLVLVDLQ